MAFVSENQTSGINFIHLGNLETLIQAISSVGHRHPGKSYETVNIVVAFILLKDLSKTTSYECGSNYGEEAKTAADDQGDTYR